MNSLTPALLPVAAKSSLGGCLRQPIPFPATNESAVVRRLLRGPQGRLDGSLTVNGYH